MSTMSGNVKKKAVAATPSLSETGSAHVARWDAATAAGDKAAAYKILTEDLSDTIVKCIRCYIGYNLPDNGKKAVEQAYDKMMDAVVEPSSQDGAAIRAPMRGMFMRVVWRRSQDALRKAEAERKKEAQDRERASIEINAGGNFEANLIRRLSLEQAIEKLPLRMRLFLRALGDGHKQAQIAATFGVTERTVRNWRITCQVDELRDLL